MNEHLQKQAITEDINWCLQAPSLLAPHPLLWQPQELKNDALQLADAAVAHLAKARQGKLGRYFESLVSFLFSQHPQFEILAQNQLIVKDKVTLGELDLLVQNTTSGEVIHLELALKFYLHVGQRADDQWAWIGSGLKDFLASKLARLYQHQLELPNIAVAQQCWPSHLPRPDRHALWIPGRLYQQPNVNSHASLQQGFANTPWRLNPLAEQSYWFEQPCSVNGEQLTKGEWLTKKQTGDARKLYASFPAQIDSKDYPLPVYVLPQQWQTNAQQAISQKFSKQTSQP